MKRLVFVMVMVGLLVMPVVAQAHTDRLARGKIAKLEQAVKLLAKQNRTLHERVNGLNDRLRVQTNRLNFLRRYRLSQDRLDLCLSGQTETGAQFPFAFGPTGTEDFMMLTTLGYAACVDEANRPS